MGCVRLDSLTIADMARLAGQPHDYPVCPSPCLGCGGDLPTSPSLPSPTYCTPECGARHRLRIQHRFGRAPLSLRQEGMETHCGYSYTPPRVR